MRPARNLMLALSLCSACSYEWHAGRSPQQIQPSVPAPQVDALASEIVLRGEGGVAFGPTEAAEVKGALKAALETLMRPRHPEDHAPARYRVRGTLARKGNWSYAYIVLPFAPFLGAPTHRVDAVVELDLQIGDAVYSAKASERVFGGFYYNYSTRERALTDAFRAALLAALSTMPKQVQKEPA